MPGFTRALAPLAMCAAVGAVSACSTSPPVAGTSTGSTSASASAAERCPGPSLRVALGPSMSPMTGEHAVVLAVTTTSVAACWVAGYPNVTLADSHGSPLTFRYERGVGPYVTHASPAQVIIGPDRQAYVLVAKYRCDDGQEDRAASLRVALPGQATAVGVALPDVPGVGQLWRCAGPGTSDPGNTVSLSPLVSSITAAAGVGQ